MLLRHWLVLLVLVALPLGGCSGPSQTSSSAGAKEPSPGSEQTSPTSPKPDPVSIAAYETFDVSAYPVRPPERTVEVRHDVPRRLMKGRADKGVKQTVEGFRIQVFSAQDQEAAQDFRERVRRWWSEAQADAPKGLFRTQPPIVIAYSQPYYRVRIGAFAEREEAAEALAFIRKEYDEAFVAQSTVTVIR